MADIYYVPLTLDNFTSLELDPDYVELELEPAISYDDFVFASAKFEGEEGGIVSAGGQCYNSVEDVTLGKYYVYNHDRASTVDLESLNEQYSGQFRVR